jgi:hypothetical protein
MYKSFRWFSYAACVIAAVGSACAQPAVEPATEVGAPAPADSSILVKALELATPSPYTRLTPKESFHLYVRDSIGLAPDLGEAASAGISQLMNSPKEWGQGAAGYGRRLANNVAYNIVRNTLTYGISIPTHEDTRYFASDKSSAGGRIAHALLSPVTARHPDGKDVFSYSNTSGIVGANLIALAWAPPSWRTPGSFATGLIWSYAGTAALNLVREYVPDLIRKLKK